eukprot:820467-Alexandrium_andersonii.AAC.1
MATSGHRPCRNWRGKRLRALPHTVLGALLPGSARAARPRAPPPRLTGCPCAHLPRPGPGWTWSSKGTAAAEAGRLPLGV